MESGMKRIRVIPVLLWRGAGLYKTAQFKRARYVGDPINAVKVFNEYEVDELTLLDIGATPKGQTPRVDLIRELASECFMPLCYGGGITTEAQAAAVFGAGVEKVSLNTAAYENPELVRTLSDRYGSQSIVVSIDVRQDMRGRYRIAVGGGRRRTAVDPRDFAERMEAAGAGELILNSIPRDGMYVGYDLELLKHVCPHVGIPVVACGGARDVEDFRTAVSEGGASAVAAGSLFVFKTRQRGVLINYPAQERLEAELYTKV